MAARKNKALEGVQRVPNEGARELVTMGPDHPIWAGHAIVFPRRGSLVRMQPPAHASDEDVQAYRQAVEAVPGVHVRVMPRAKADAPVPETTGSAVPHKAPREAVLARVARARVEDPDAFRAYVEGICEEVGL